MNIIIPTGSPLCNPGAIIDLTLIKFAHALSKKHTVYVIYSGNISHNRIEKYYDITINDNLNFLPTYRLKIFKPIKLSISQISKWHIVKHINHLTSDKRQCIIYSLGTSLHYYLNLFAHKKNIKLMYEIHATFNMPKFSDSQNIALFATTTYALKEKIIHRNNSIKKVVVLHLPVSLSNISSSEYETNQDSKILIYMGKLHRDRGFYFLLDCLKILDSDYKLVVFGGIDRDIQKAEYYCRKLNISQKITFHGALPVKELSIKISDIKGGIVVVPPLNIRGYNELAHTKASDGLATSKIIVASDLKSIRELIPDGNGFFQAGNTDDFVQTVRNIQTILPNQLNATVKANQKIASQLTYQRRAEILLSEIEAIA